MDGLIERCHGYRAQAEAYRNNCIDGQQKNIYKQIFKIFLHAELHTQLILLMSTLEGLPRVIFGGVVIQSQERLKLTLLETLQPFTQEIDTLKTIKVICTSIVKYLCNITCTSTFFNSTIFKRIYISFPLNVHVHLLIEHITYMFHLYMYTY